MHRASTVCVQFLQRRSTLNPLLLKGHRKRDSGAEAGGGGVHQVKRLLGLFAFLSVPTEAET